MGFEERIRAKAQISSKPHIMGGMPCVDGTRVPAETILAGINAGETLFGILSAYPWLPEGAVNAVVDWALADGRDVSLPVRRVPEFTINPPRD